MSVCGRQNNNSLQKYLVLILRICEGFVDVIKLRNWGWTT